MNRKLLSPDLDHGLIAMVPDKLLKSGQPDFSLFGPRIRGIVEVQEFVIDTGHGNPVRQVFFAAKQGVCHDQRNMI